MLLFLRRDETSHRYAQTLGSSYVTALPGATIWINDRVSKAAPNDRSVGYGERRWVDILLSREQGTTGSMNPGLACSQ